MRVGTILSASAKEGEKKKDFSKDLGLNIF